METVDNIKSSKSKANSVRRGRCRQCAPCLLPDCGKCEHCLKKKKFGGDGTSRQACVQRNCVVIHGDGTNPPPPRSHHKGGTHRSRGSAVGGGGRSSLLSRTTCNSGSGGNHDTTDGGMGIDSSSDNGGGGVGGVKSATSTMSRKKVATTSKRPFTFPTTMEKVLFPAASLSSSASKQEDQQKLPQGNREPKEEGKEDPVEDQSEDQQPPPKKKLLLETKLFRRFMGRKPPPAPALGACAKCGIGEDHPNNPVLLCDGPGCDREYHLNCIDYLEEVPEGNWYCVDCHPTGSGYESLVSYLEATDENRSHYADSQAFCFAQWSTDLDSPKDLSTMIPESELKRAQAARLPDDEWLVGKPIWIHLPNLKMHVPGRIVDQRPAMKPIHAVSDRDGACSTNKSGPVPKEHLIRFAAGHFGRKESYYHWINLEEHRLIVGDQIVWATPGYSASSPAPALAVLCTTRELILNQPKSLPTGKKKKAPHPKQLTKLSSLAQSCCLHTTAYFFGLAEFVGNMHIVSRDLWDSKMQTMHASRCLNAMAAAQAELQEQQAVFEWRAIPQLNPFHSHALKNRDHFSLPPVVPHDTRPDTKTNIELTQGIAHTSLCPLVMTGVDPQFVMNLLQKNYRLTPSKELAASLTCKIVPLESPLQQENPQATETMEVEATAS